MHRTRARALVAALFVVGVAILLQSAVSAAASSAPDDWTQYGVDPARSNASPVPSKITAAILPKLRRQQVALPGTADSSPDYVQGVTVAGKTRDVFVVTTTYGKTVAVDASSGHLLWTFTPPGYSSLGRQRPDHDRDPARRRRAGHRLRSVARRQDPRARAREWP